MEGLCPPVACQAQEIEEVHLHSDPAGPGGCRLTEHGEQSPEVQINLPFNSVVREDISYRSS